MRAAKDRIVISRNDGYLIRSIPEFVKMRVSQPCLCSSLLPYCSSVTDTTAPAPPAPLVSQPFQRCCVFASNLGGKHQLLHTHVKCALCGVKQCTVRR